MAASDALPVARKNAAYRLYFDMRDSSGGLVMSWTGISATISQDGGGFTACTNTATEIGSSGCGYLDLTSAEMNYDGVIVKVTVTNTGAVAMVKPLYPESEGDYRIDADTIWDDLVSNNTTSGSFGKYITDIYTGTTNLQAGVNVTEINGSAASLVTEDGIVDAVWDEHVADHTITGSTGDALIVSSGNLSELQASDIWSYSSRSLTDIVDARMIQVSGDALGTIATQGELNYWGLILLNNCGGGDVG